MENHEEQFDNAKVLHTTDLCKFRHPGSQLADRLEK